MTFEVMGFEINVTGKLIVKAVLFLIITVALSLAFSGGRSSLTTSEEVCTQNAIAVGVEPLGCDGP